MFAEVVFVGYDENGIPMFKTVYSTCKDMPICIGSIRDEEGRVIPIYA